MTPSPGMMRGERSHRYASRKAVYHGVLNGPACCNRLSSYFTCLFNVNVNRVFYLLF
jgi:hypothetical protein